MAGPPAFETESSAGYSYAEARAFLAALSPEGADFYLRVQHRLDLIYPALLAISTGWAMVRLAPRWRWRLALLLAPISAMVFDYLENRAVAAMLSAGADALTPEMVAQAKGLSTALRVPDARIVQERSSPLGLVTVVESPTIPFRHAPGLSLNNLTEPPPQLGVFTDAESISTITRFEGDLAALEYLDFTTSALPYHLLEDPQVLILGAGGGEQLLLALYHGAAGIDAVELNPQVLDLVAEQYAGFAGGLYGRPEVDVHLGEARSFVERTAGRYDLIQIPLLYSFGAAAAGTQSLHESYTYTVEAIGAYLDKLERGGLLSITLWLKLPPRDTLKLFATAVEALEARGVADPGERLMLIRSWKTSTLLVKNGAITSAEIEQLKEFASGRSFDVAWYPGIPSEEANVYNILEAPWFYDAARALVGPEADDYIASYKFAIAPATDDQPFFYDFFKWRYLPELLRLRTQGAAAMLDMGYLILFATLVQAVILSLVLILLPLAIRRHRFGGAAPKARTSLYFVAIGLAFLFIEIAYIQRFILFLGHPLYAVAVVLAGFLVFAGVGSALAPRLDARLRFGALPLAVGGITAIALGYLVVLPPVFDALIARPDPTKILVSLALIAPLAACMGMPFPLGIARLAGANEELVPWAWGINGCASVVAAVLAALLAIHFGFTAVVSCAVALYLTTLLTAGVRHAR